MIIRSILAALTVLIAATAVMAQEHYTEGPVWSVSYYRIADDQFDAYMKYLRSSVLPQDEEAKKQGLVLEQKTFVKLPDGPDDWNIAFAVLYRNAADAMDYNKEREDRAKAIAAKQYKTENEDKQREIIKPRLEMRRFLGTRIMREITLKPMTN